MSLSTTINAINARSNNTTTKTTDEGDNVVDGVFLVVNLLRPHRRRRILQSIAVSVVDSDDEMAVILAVSVVAASWPIVLFVGLVVGVCYESMISAAYHTFPIEVCPTKLISLSPFESERTEQSIGAVSPPSSVYVCITSSILCVRINVL